MAMPSAMPMAITRLLRRLVVRVGWRRMLARELAAMEAVEDGRTCRTNKTPDPTWEQVSEAICRLDRCRFPALWINLSKSEECEGIPGLRVMGFSVMGGQGTYWLMCSG